MTDRKLLDQSCAGCSKQAVDGWALYCVECCEQIQPAGWISVEVRLPDDDCYVLGATWKTLDDRQHVEIVSYRSGAGGFSFDPVTHWMPLPVPPIAKVEGK